MLFSHISDTHLGLVQYGADERTADVYEAFNEAIDRSIGDRVDFVIFAGDIFHKPNPDGTAILQMANGLKRLKEKGIGSFFILGEHDISRIRSTPVPYVYHNLGFARYVGDGRPVLHKGVLIAGLDKIRQSEIPGCAERLAKLDEEARGHVGHRILVMHQGITEFNRFAGEMQSTDLPKNFTYYAMGHLHARDVREFAHLGGPVAYPGSTEATANEGAAETGKGFFEVDISGEAAVPRWIELRSARPQLLFKTKAGDLSSTIDEIAGKIEGYGKKPIVRIEIQGDGDGGDGRGVDADYVRAQVSRLDPLVLKCFDRVTAPAGGPDASGAGQGSVLLSRPGAINDEMFRLAAKALGSEEAAGFAIRGLLPALASGDLDRASQVIQDGFEEFKREEEEVEGEAGDGDEEAEGGVGKAQ